MPNPFKDTTSSDERILKDLYFGRLIERLGRNFNRSDGLPVNAAALQVLRKNCYLEWDDSGQYSRVKLTSQGLAVAEHLAEEVTGVTPTSAV